MRGRPPKGDALTRETAAVSGLETRGRGGGGRGGGLQGGHCPRRDGCCERGREEAPDDKLVVASTSTACCGEMGGRRGAMTARQPNIQSAASQLQHRPTLRLALRSHRRGRQSGTSSAEGERPYAVVVLRLRELRADARRAFVVIGVRAAAAGRLDRRPRRTTSDRNRATTTLVARPGSTRVCAWVAPPGRRRRSPLPARSCTQAAVPASSRSASSGRPRR